MKDTPGLRFHLAQCETEQGHLVEAALEYERANDLLRHGAKAPDVQKLLGPANDALKRRTPHLTVDLPADLSAPAISIDGKGYPPSELALGLSLNPGQHVLRVAAAGRNNFERSLLLKEGEDVALRPQLASSAPPRLSPASSAPPTTVAKPSADVPAREAKSLSAKPYVMIGEAALTVAGLAVGIGYGLAQSSASDRVGLAQGRIDSAERGNCSSGDETLLSACSDLQSALSDHDRAVLLSDVGFITAGVGAIALVATGLVWPNASKKDAAVTLQPIAGLGRVGLLGRF